MTKPVCRLTLRLTRGPQWVMQPDRWVAVARTLTYLKKHDRSRELLQGSVASPSEFAPYWYNSYNPKLLKRGYVRECKGDYYKGCCGGYSNFRPMAQMIWQSWSGPHTAGTNSSLAWQNVLYQRGQWILPAQQGASTDCHVFTLQGLEPGSLHVKPYAG